MKKWLYLSISLIMFFLTLTNAISVFALQESTTAVFSETSIQITPSPTPDSLTPTPSVLPIPTGSMLIFSDDMSKADPITNKSSTYLKVDGGIYNGSFYYSKNDLYVFYDIESPNTSFLLTIDNGTLGYKNIYVRVLSAGCGNISWNNQILGKILGPNKPYCFALPAEANNSSSFKLLFETDKERSSQNWGGFHIYKIEIYGEKDLSLKPSVSTPTPTALPKILYGDVTGDGFVDSADYTQLRRYLIGKDSRLPIENGEIVADINIDGSVDSGDYVLLRKYLLDIITFLPHSGPIPTSTPTFIPTPTVKSDDHGNSYNEATNLSGTINGNIDYPEDIDCFSFSIMYIDIYPPPPRALCTVTLTSDIDVKLSNLDSYTVDGNKKIYKFIDSGSNNMAVVGNGQTGAYTISLKVN